MNYTRNEDKIGDWMPGVSYNQVMDVSNDAAVTEPLLLVDAKAWMKMEDTYDDDLITALIPAARRMVEQYTNINCVARTVTAVINNYNGGTYLPYGPIGAIASVTDTDENVVDTDGYKVLGTKWKQIQYPTEELIITYTGGYDTCPAEFITAIKAQVLFLYENRGDGTTELSPIAKMILNPLRRVS